MKKRKLGIVVLMIISFILILLGVAGCKKNNSPSESLSNSSNIERKEIQVRYIIGTEIIIDKYGNIVPTDHITKKDVYTYTDEIFIADFVPALKDCDGYNFMGWTYIDGTPYQEKCLSENVILVSQWEAKTYKFTIKFDSNGGNNIENRIIEVKYGDLYQIPIPENGNYYFNGWKCNGEFVWERNDRILSPGSEIEIQKYYTTEVVFVADWISPLKVSFINIGEKGSLLGDGYYQKYERVEVSAFANDGYEFEGWYVNGKPVSGTSDYFFYIESDIELTANWIGKTYLVYLDYGNGYGSFYVTEVVYGESFSIPTPTYIPAEMKFLYWEIDGIPITNENGDSLSTWNYKEWKNAVAIYTYN